LRRILVLDADPSHRGALQVTLAQRGYQADAVGSAERAQQQLAERVYECVICDRGFVDMALAAPNSPTVLAVGESSEAYDWLPRPVDTRALVMALRRVDERVALLRAAGRLGAAIQTPVSPPEIDGAALGMVGMSEPMRRVIAELVKVAPYKTNVLISGESGTGKELVARALHSLSPRRSGPFVAVNCGAIPVNLLESELFGHRKGAFTDAIRDKKGLFVEANGGTLFLDEIGELPLELQVKLLRVLQEEEVRPIGDNAAVPVDPRIVAATVRDLAADVQSGLFREDLYYRLNVLPMHLPPLRDRRADIPALVGHFIRVYQEKHAGAGMQVQGTTEQTMALLMSYSWPGNIRELENTIERAMVLCEGSLIGAELLEARLSNRPAPVEQPWRSALESDQLSIKKATRAVERTLIERALQQTGGNRTNASKLLEISHRALLYKIKEYGL
jgi:two-component system, NtrC family, response regulator AtoC